MNVKVFFVRGLPGSGKSTYARNIIKPDIICEADSYFIKDGHYNFVAEDLGKAHDQCYNEFCNAVENNKSVAVCNTFSKYWEIKRYIEFCRDKHIKFKIIKMNTIYKSTHNVPEETIQRMKDRWQDFKNEHYVD